MYPININREEIIFIHNKFNQLQVCDHITVKSRIESRNPTETMKVEIYDTKSSSSLYGN